MDGFRDWSSPPSARAPGELIQIRKSIEKERENMNKTKAAMRQPSFFAKRSINLYLSLYFSMPISGGFRDSSVFFRSRSRGDGEMASNVAMASKRRGDGSLSSLLVGFARFYLFGQTKEAEKAWVLDGFSSCLCRVVRSLRLLPWRHH